MRPHVSFLHVCPHEEVLFLMNSLSLSLSLALSFTPSLIVWKGRQGGWKTEGEWLPMFPRGLSNTPEVCKSVKRELINNQKRPTIIGMVANVSKRSIQYTWNRESYPIHLKQRALSNTPETERAWAIARAREWVKRERDRERAREIERAWRVRKTWGEGKRGAGVRGKGTWSERGRHGGGWEWREIESHRERETDRWR